MDIVEFERRLRALAKRDGLTFATFATLPPADRAVLVATIAQCFDAAAVYREREVNERLKTWRPTKEELDRRNAIRTSDVLRSDGCAASPSEAKVLSVLLVTVLISKEVLGGRVSGPG